MPGARQDVTERLLSEATQRAGVQGQLAKRRKQIAAIVAGMKSATDVKLEAIQKILDGKAPAAEETKEGFFPRGVVHLLAPHPKGVAFFLQEQCVAQELDMSTEELQQELHGNHKTEVAKLYMLGIEKEALSPLPDKKMTHKAFKNWYHKEHEKNGRPLDEIVLGEKIDMNFDNGPFELCKSNEDNDFFDMIREKKTGIAATIKLLGKVAHTISEQEVADGVWELDRNWHKNDTVLTLVAAGSQDLVMPLFDNETVQEDITLNMNELLDKEVINQNR